MLIDSLVGVLLTDGGEGVEEEEGTGGGVELREERGGNPELRTSVLASNLAATLYRSFLRLLLAVVSSFGADFDSRPSMTVQYAVICGRGLRQSC